LCSDDRCRVCRDRRYVCLYEKSDHH
jgi:hypothetical protein